MSDSAGGSKKSVDMPLCQTRKPSGAWPVRHVVFGCVDGDQFSLAVIREEKEGQRERSASRVKSRDQGGGPSPSPCGRFCDLCQVGTTHIIPNGSSPATFIPLC